MIARTGVHDPNDEQLLLTRGYAVNSGGRLELRFWVGDHWVSDNGCHGPWINQTTYWTTCWGSHLHFEVRIPQGEPQMGEALPPNGQYQVNPTKWVDF